jgi:hypothetical protein
LMTIPPYAFAILRNPAIHLSYHNPTKIQTTSATPNSALTAMKPRQSKRYGQRISR